MDDKLFDDLDLPPHVAGEVARRLDASEGIVGRVDVEGALAAVMRNDVSAKRHPILKYVGISVAVILLIAIGIKYIPIYETRLQYTVYSTTNGQRANVTLPDGSRVILAPATTLRIAKRSVELTGEAVFTVNQHTGGPFTVRAGSTITRVLGTTFGVRAYDQSIRVVVSDGKVTVGNVTLSNGDVATITTSMPQVQRNADVAGMLGWTSGRLVFKNTPLRDAIPDLNRWYDVDIRLVNPSLGSRALLGPMPAASPAELAYTLGKVLDVKVERNGRVLVLK